MKATLAFVRLNLRLALRERPVLFFNYIFPLVFFFFFAQFMHASSGSVTQIVTMVLVIGVLGNGLFGAGIRSVADREANILRRYKVAPISPLPILFASIVTGWILYLPTVLLLLVLSHFLYNMAFPPALISLLLFISVGAMVFRSIGLIIASVANSTAESTIMVQLLYMPMLFFSGTTIPLSALPNWLQIAAQFLPSAYLLSGLQAIVLQQESIVNKSEAQAVLALLLTACFAVFVSVKLFRWEKEEKLKGSAKLWVAAAFLPFVVLGSYQAYSRESITKSKLLERNMRRNHARLIRNAQVFVGDGQVLPIASVLMRNGKIEQVFAGSAPDAKQLNADLVEASGKTLLPGLIDVHVHLGSPGGLYSDQKEYLNNDRLRRELAAYLYSGVTTVRSTGDVIDETLKLRAGVNSGEELGANLFACGPLFTAAGGHGTEYAKNMPEMARAQFNDQFVRVPKSAQDARQQVADLKKRGVDCIKAVMEAGAGTVHFNRLDPAILKAIGQAAKEQNLPFAVHTGDAQDVMDALAAGATSIEHGSLRAKLPDALFTQMAAQNVFYDATLSVGEGFRDLAEGKFDLLNRSLVQQVAPPGLLKATKDQFDSADGLKMREGFRGFPTDLAIAMDNLKRAATAGVTLVTGSDAGNFFVIHGPTVQREMELYVQAGLSPEAALQAATWNAARLLRADGRIGSIRAGKDATVVLVDGNPLQDITATERISEVWLKGEWIDRSELLAPR